MDAERPIEPGATSALPDLPPIQTWPKPFGITSIVFGAINLTCLGCGVAGMMMPVIFASGMQQQFPDGVPPSVAAPSMLLVGIFGLSAVLQLFLIASGSMLVMRRPIARPMHLVYGVLAIILFVISTVVSVQGQVEITEWCKANPNSKFAQQQQASGWIGQAIGWTVGIVFGFLWPVVCLAWFGLIKRQNSDITSEDSPVI